jgi:hypothetical protein
MGACSWVWSLWSWEQTEADTFYSWWSEQFSQCTQQGCNWWVLCLNVLFCWITMIIILIVVTILLLVVLLIIGVFLLVCYASCLPTWVLLYLMSFLQIPYFCGDPDSSTGSLNGNSGDTSGSQVGMFTLGGTLTYGPGVSIPTGYALQLNVGAASSGASPQTLTPMSSGPFTFPNSVPNNFTYSVGYAWLSNNAPSAPPAGLSVSVTNGSGQVQGANVTTVQVTVSKTSGGQTGV